MRKSKVQSQKSKVLFSLALTFYKWVLYFRRNVLVSGYFVYHLCNLVRFSWFDDLLIMDFYPGLLNFENTKLGYFHVYNFPKVKLNLIHGFNFREISNPFIYTKLFSR